MEYELDFAEYDGENDELNELVNEMYSRCGMGDGDGDPVEMAEKAIWWLAAFGTGSQKTELRKSVPGAVGWNKSDFDDRLDEANQEMVLKRVEFDNIRKRVPENRKGSEKVEWQIDISVDGRTEEVILDGETLNSSAAMQTTLFNIGHRPIKLENWLDTLGALMSRNDVEIVNPTATSAEGRVADKLVDVVPFSSVTRSKQEFLVNEGFVLLREDDPESDGVEGEVLVSEDTVHNTADSVVDDFDMETLVDVVMDDITSEKAQKKVDDEYAPALALDLQSLNERSQDGVEHLLANADEE